MHENLICCLQGKFTIICTTHVSLNVHVWFDNELSNSSTFSYIIKEKRWCKVLDDAKVHRDFWQFGSFSTRIFYFIFSRFSDFSKVLNNHLGISEFFSQKGQLDFSFSTLELAVDIALSLSISFCQKQDT